MQIPIILAIDFDDTIAKAEWPTLGDPKKDGVYYINKLKKEGYYIIIWTCREGEHVEWIKDWCINWRLQYHLINEHHPKLIEFYKSDTRKICADIYIDDKQLGGLPDDWETIYHLVHKQSSLLQKKVLDL